MRELENLVEKWDQKYLQTNESEHVLAKGHYEEYMENIICLRNLKYRPYQPISHPVEKDFFDRLKEWLFQFSPEDRCYLFYLASKIIYFTIEQLFALMENLFSRKIKPLILNKIIEKENLKPFSYLEAQQFFESELEKTIFVGLTDSSRINEFSHRVREIKRHKTIGLSLETLLYPTKQKLLYSSTLQEEKRNICEEFEKEIVINDTSIKDKKRLVILEDFSGTGQDIWKNLSLIENSYLEFTDIIIAPYIITFKAKERIQSWINTGSKNRNYYLVYGTIIPEAMKCFDYEKSYLKSDWRDKSKEICEKIKKISEKAYDDTFRDEINHNHKHGFGNLKIAFAYYFNCPDTTLPIIWFNKSNWKPLFERSSRIF